MRTRPELPTHLDDIAIDAGQVVLRGILEVPPLARGLVIFAHGSGSGRHSARNRRVADELQGHQFATLLFDLLTEEEGQREAAGGHLRFEIDFLAGRLRMATDWSRAYPETSALPTAYFGASTGAAAALVAAAGEGPFIRAVVSRGGRPDLAGDALPAVDAPTLLIVGSADGAVVGLNQLALRRLREPKRLEILPGAGHLFEEPGALEEVALLAARWFERHLVVHRA